MDRAKSKLDFPPSDDAWATHRLADIAPAPNSIGSGWTFEHGHRNEAKPPNPHDAIPGCDASVPPTLDGFNVEYHNAAEPIERELELTIGEGTVKDAEAVVGSFRQLSDCDLTGLEFGSGLDLRDATVDGADDSLVMTATFDRGGPGHVVQAIGVVRVDGLTIAAFFATNAEITPQEAAEDLAALLADVLARR